MAQTTFPYRPSRSGDAASIAWTVWQMLQYFVNAVYDVFVSKFFIGQAVIAGGNTSVVVNVSTGVVAYQAFVTPQSDPGSRYWVDTKTSLGFTIHLSVAPAGAVTFDYLVKVP